MKYYLLLGLLLSGTVAASEPAYELLIRNRDDVIEYRGDPQTKAHCLQRATEMQADVSSKGGTVLCHLID